MLSYRNEPITITMTYKDLDFVAHAVLMSKTDATKRIHEAWKVGDTPKMNDAKAYRRRMDGIYKQLTEALTEARINTQGVTE